MSPLSEKTIKWFSLVLLFFGMASMVACDKGEKECPLNTFRIECDESSVDFVFGGYLTGTHQYTIQASYCLDDGQKLADDMSYDFGQSYRHCRQLP